MDPIQAGNICRNLHMPILLKCVFRDSQKKFLCLSFGRKFNRVAETRTAAIAFYIGLCALCVVAAAGGSEKKPLTIAMSVTPLSSPVIIAKHEGYFARYGLDVTILDFAGGHRAANALFTGRADIATSSEVVVMFNSFARDDFALLVTFVSSDNDIKIVTRKDTGIRTLEDLAGHKVGTVMGASAQFFLDESLVLADVDRSLLDIVHVDPEHSASALASGRLDAIVVWEPYAYQSQIKLADNAVLVGHEQVYTETFNALVLRDFAQNNPHTLQQFVRALIEATDFIVAHPQDSQRIVAKRLDADIAFIDAVWKDFDFEISLHQWLLTTLEAQARWAIEFELVTARKGPNYLDFILPEVLSSIRPGLVTVFQ